MQSSLTESYLSVFLSSAFAKGDLLAVLSLMLLFLGRMLPIIALSPFLGSRVLTNPAKVALALSLFVIMTPQLLLYTTRPTGFNTELLLLMFKEMFVGVSMGFIIGIPFTIVQCAGMIIDHQRGGASLMVNDPTIQNQSSPFGTLFNMVLIYIFYVIDGPFILFDSILKSYEVLPIDRFLSPEFFAPNSPFWLNMIKLFNEVMIISIQMCTPALIAILMTDVFLGIANRLAPQVQITFLGMPLKSLLAIFVIWAGWYLLVAEFAKQGHFWLNKVAEMVSFFKPSP